MFSGRSGSLPGFRSPADEILSKKKKWTDLKTKADLTVCFESKSGNKF